MHVDQLSFGEVSNQELVGRKQQSCLTLFLRELQLSANALSNPHTKVVLPKMSVPSRASGIAFDWIGVGIENCSFVVACCSL